VAAILVCIGFIAISSSSRYRDPGRFVQHRSLYHVTPNEVAGILSRCRDWTSLTYGDTEGAAEIVNSLAPILSASLQDVEQGTRQFLMAQHQDPNSVDVTFSRLYVLNRMLFRIPKSSSEDLPSFGSFRGVPTYHGKLDASWPVEELPNGGLKLAAWFGGYAGPRYRWIDEFYYFRTHYKKRELDVGGR
jgi:hypothetical protein